MCWVAVQSCLTFWLFRIQSSSQKHSKTRFQKTNLQLWQISFRRQQDQFTFQMTQSIISLEISMKPMLQVTKSWLKNSMSFQNDFQMNLIKSVKQLNRSQNAVSTFPKFTNLDFLLNFKRCIKILNLLLADGAP